MNTERFLKDLAARARAEEPPRAEVVDAVLARIRVERSERMDVMEVFAGASAAAAAIVVAYAVQAWSALQDPITSMLASMNPGLQ